MSITNNLKVVNLPAGEDFNGARYCTVRIDSNGRARTATAATQVVVGVVAEDPKRTTASDGSDEVAVAMIGGSALGLVKIGATVTAGQILVGAADGEAAGVADSGSLAVDSQGFGVALRGGGDGDVILFAPRHVGAAHTI